MSAVILLLFGLGLADTIRAPVLPADEEPDRGRRDLVALIFSPALTIVLAWLLGSSGLELVGVGLVAVLVVAIWLGLPRSGFIDGPLPQLAFLATVFAVASVVSLIDPSGGEFRTWYEGLEWGFPGDVSYQRFAMALACGLYSLAAGNRVVTLVLEAAGTPREKGEQKLKGGRLLGPMERLIVAGMILSGEPAGAAIVFAAKGLLRLPNVRGIDECGSSAPHTEVKPEHADEASWTVAEYTEYFLIGTFASLLLAASLALMVLGTS